MAKKVALVLGGIMTGIIMTLAVAKMIPIDDDSDMKAGYQGKRILP